MTIKIHKWQFDDNINTNININRRNINNWSVWICKNKLVISFNKSITRYWYGKDPYEAKISVFNLQTIKYKFKVY